MNEIINTNWHNRTVSVTTQKGDVIADKLKAELPSLVSKIDGQIECSIRLQKYVKVNVTAGQDIVAKLASLFGDMQSPANGTEVVIDFIVPKKLDTTVLTAAQLKTAITDPECKQILGRENKTP